MSLEKLFTPFKLGALTLPNRIVMPPLTRSRAGQPGDVPTEMNALYYAQRATAGLIVSEGSPISRQGTGYAATPGIYSDAQEAGWKNVVNAIHGHGGKIALQLWHVGRISCRFFQPDGALPVAPSALVAQGVSCFVPGEGMVPADTPRALETKEIAGIVADFAAAGQRAMRAGFDLVEVHSANGYLLNQFLATNCNQRSDAYGGSLENRARFLLEAVDALGKAIGFDKVGVRLSPGGTIHDIDDAQAEEMALYLAGEFQKRTTAYLHLVDPSGTGGRAWSTSFLARIRKAYSGAIIVCAGYDASKAEALLGTGNADAVGFGKLYIANPDLVERFRRGASLNVPDSKTFYGGGEKGYTDYPMLGDA
ncbi:MAG: alkene reductase [Betaproteobacteria bacterium]|nr:alkene reductase [Betaproteobacteria bacterium]